MLDHDQGVAQVAQTLHGGNQLIVVALVQADARLVQHIQHTGQCAANLGRQADTLAFAAGQGGRTAGKGQIPQTHALQKAQALTDLFKNRRTDHLILGADLGGLDEFQLFGNALVAEIRNVDAADRDGQAGGLQAAAMAGGALLAGHDKGNLFLDPLAVRLAEAAFQVRDKALKLVVIGAGAKHALALHLNALIAGAVQQGVQGFFAEIFDGRVQRKAVALTKRLIIHF